MRERQERLVIDRPTNNLERTNITNRFELSNHDFRFCIGGLLFIYS